MSQQPIYTFATWQVQPGHLERVLVMLTEVAEKSRQEAGNLGYRIHQSHSDAHTLVLAEAYRDMAAVEAHRASAYFQELVINQIIPLLESREVVLTSEVLFDHP